MRSRVSAWSKKLRLAVANEPERPRPPPQAKKAPKAATTFRSVQDAAGGAPKAAGGAGKARPLTDGYSLDGEPPAGADVAAIEKLLAARVAAKIAKDFDTADKLQAELQGMGVYQNDRQRTWSGTPSAKQP